MPLISPVVLSNSILYKPGPKGIEGPFTAKQHQAAIVPVSAAIVSGTFVSPLVPSCVRFQPPSSVALISTVPNPTFCLIAYSSFLFGREIMDV